MNKNQFATTPPMGWNSYDYYDTTVNEQQIRENAEFMAKHLKKYGWEYIVIDIEWYSNDAGTKRNDHQYIPFGDDQIDEFGRFQPSPIRFPSSANGTGFTELAAYVHSLGLKFGIHIMRGIPRIAAQNHCPIYNSNYTANVVADPSSICGWNPDMYGVRNTEGGQAYYDSIISMYADWGVDFIKCDDICDSWMYRHEGFNGWFEIEMLHKAILKTNRPIVLSLSPGPAHIDKAWTYSLNANMWRITDDFWDKWDLLKNMFWRCEMWQDHVKEGCYPDCDMLPIGKVGKGFGEERNCNFSSEELKTMFSLWCMFRSPLMLGTELTKLSKDELSILCNPKLYSLLQNDRVGHQILRNEDEAIWINKSTTSNSFAIALFNLSEKERRISYSLEDMNITTLTEIWTDEAVSIEGNTISATIPAHGVKLYML